MDPNANLNEQLELAERLADGSAYASDPDYAAKDAQRLAELALELHNWIKGGGFLPAGMEVPKPQSKTDIVQELAIAKGWPIAVALANDIKKLDVNTLEMAYKGEELAQWVLEAEVIVHALEADVAPDGDVCLSPLVEKLFQTSDGYELRLAYKLRPVWTDGDLVFEDKGGWPVDFQGQRLEGTHGQ